MLEDVLHFPKSQYLTKMTSQYLLKTTSPIESHFNKVEKGQGQKALDSNVNQFEAPVRRAEDNKQLLVDSILYKIKLILNKNEVNKSQTNFKKANRQHIS